MARVAETVNMAQLAGNVSTANSLANASATSPTFAASLVAH